MAVNQSNGNAQQNLSEIIDNLIIDNDTNQITPAVMRQVLKAIAVNIVPNINNPSALTAQSPLNLDAFTGSLSLNENELAKKSENIATILKRCPNNDFRNAHGTLFVNDKYYVGTRGAGTFIAYNDLDNINNPANRTVITIPSVTSLQGIESVCYDAVNNKIYFAISNTTKLVVINDPDDITDYTVHTIAGMGSLKFSGSAPIISNGTSIFIVSETDVNPSLFKISCANFTLTSTTAMSFGNGHGAHSGYISPDGLWGYFANNGSNCYFARVNLTTLAVTSIFVGDGITDDMVYIPSFPLLKNCVALFSVIPSPNNKSCILVNVEDTTMSIIDNIDFQPSFGGCYDELNGILYSVSTNGFIESVNLNDYNLSGKFLPKTYIIRGITPKEIIMRTVEDVSTFFVTDWNNTDGKGSLLEVVLDECFNPGMTKTEFKNRFYNPLMELKQAQYFIQQDFYGFSTFIELRNNTGIDFGPFEAFDVGKINCPQYDFSRMTAECKQVDLKTQSFGRFVPNSTTAGAVFWVFDRDNNLSEDVFKYGGILTITVFEKEFNIKN